MKIKIKLKNIAKNFLDTSVNNNTNSIHSNNTSNIENIDENI